MHRYFFKHFMATLQPSKLLQKNFIQDWIGFIAVVGMIFGFVAARSVLTISMLVLFLNIFWPLQFKETFKSWKSNRFAVLALAYFLINFIGGLWSVKQEVWYDIVMMHLPFVILPIGMLTVPFDKLFFRRLFLVALYAISLATITISLVLFFLNMDMYLAGIQQSKMIPTIRENDHIRFSLFLVLSLVPGIAYIQSEWKKETDRRFKGFIIFSLITIFVYLHILSAKTGLLVLYFLVVLILFKYFYDKGYKWKAFVLPPLIILAMFTLAYFTLDTVKGKVDYVIYEFYYFMDGKPLDYNYSDAGRLISYQIAFHEMKDHLLVGVGTGDVMMNMREGYSLLYPNVPIENQLIPHNQYLYSLLAFGLLFFPFFLGLQFVPFQAKLGKTQFFLNISALLLIVAMLVEAMLQVQLGVFVYLFFMTIWYKWELKNG